MIVLDASAALELVRGSDVGLGLSQRIATSESTLHAPNLLSLEVTQALRRAEAVGTMSPRRAAAALNDLLGLKLVRYGHELTLWRVWELRANLTAYDASYVALAEALDAPLVTCDGRLARAPGHRAEVELLST